MQLSTMGWLGAMRVDDQSGEQLGARTLSAAHGGSREGTVRKIGYPSLHLKSANSGFVSLVLTLCLGGCAGLPNRLKIDIDSYNPTPAVRKLYDRAALGADLDAQSKLAHSFELGLGVKRDVCVAKYIYTKIYERPNSHQSWQYVPSVDAIGTKSYLMHIDNTKSNTYQISSALALTRLKDAQCPTHDE